MATVVLTGASAGLGAAAAVMLTAMGHEVLATGRSAEKLEAVRGRMEAVALGGVAVPEPVAADFASLAEVRRFADIVAERMPRVDVLANNAGLTTRRREESADGFELTFAVNHLAPFLLTSRLVDRVGRVVTTSSVLHRLGRIDVDDLDLRRRWSRLRSYGTSKLANVLFTAELARRTDIAATCLHPGGVDTDIGRDARFTAVVKRLGRHLRTPEQGADTLVWLAASAEGGAPTAVYYADRAPARTSRAARDPALAAALWDRSAQLVAPFAG